jgi:exodeoxyribonuclease-3
MKIVTWNINGIRSLKDTDWQEVLKPLDADIICLQETKVNRKIADVFYSTNCLTLKIKCF